MSRSSLALAVATSAAFLLLLVGLIVLGTRTHIGIGPTTQGGSTVANLGLVLFGAATTLGLFTVLVAVGFDDTRQQRTMSPLYLPLVAVVAAMLGVLTISALTALDLLVHDLRRTWAPLYEQETRLLSSSLFLAFAVALAWLLGVILHGHGVNRWALAVLYSVIAAIGLVAVVVAVRL